ncbi:gluconokinase [Salinisphaera sp. USBA-960]|uniref:gluconokinase n=1 Tax=Salinisphaera orenii TaxID=856731 RepID=UPI001472A079|nr:gluconokinase [Salifodinibacter halophilus]NNC25937.1 gluconokinase [Salifodinibacter halophilus]
MDRRVIVMGVSGIGKSSLGEAIGTNLSVPYIDGDQYHPQANVDKMAHGTPLNDDDRAGWLDKLSNLISDHQNQGQSALIGCSALKKSYREKLRQGDPNLLFLFLEGSFEVIRARMRQRDHFFSDDLLVTQFETLEAPGADEAIAVNIDSDFDTVVSRALDSLRPYFT